MLALRPVPPRPSLAIWTRPYEPNSKRPVSPGMLGRAMGAVGTRMGVDGAVTCGGGGGGAGVDAGGTVAAGAGSCARAEAARARTSATALERARWRMVLGQGARRAAPCAPSEIVIVEPVTWTSGPPMWS